MSEPSTAGLNVFGNRYQILKRLGGDSASQLCVATDLHSGTLVCLRLWSLHAHTGNWRALPKLARQPANGSAPLLPFAYGVERNTAYTVRPFQSGISLREALTNDRFASFAMRVTIAAGLVTAVQLAHRNAFFNGDFAAEDVIVSSSGEVKLTGFDRVGAGRPVAARALDVSRMFALTSEVLAHPALRSPRQQQQLARLHRLVTAEQAQAVPSLAKLSSVLRRMQQTANRGSGVEQGTNRRSEPSTWRPWVRRVQRLGLLVRVYSIAAAFVAGIALGGYQLLQAPPASVRQVQLVMPDAAPDGTLGTSTGNLQVSTPPLSVAVVNTLPAQARPTALPPAHDSVQFAGIDTPVPAKPAVSASTRSTPASKRAQRAPTATALASQPSRHTANQSPAKPVTHPRTSTKQAHK